MREILFRGKQMDNGDWIEGYYLVAAGMAFISIFGIRSPVQVDCETVGQYTGLKDKYDKNIFEGDIVKVTYTSSDGEIRKENTLVKYDDVDCCFYPMRWNESCEWCDYSTEINEIEVVGNIHDNPELLMQTQNKFTS